MADRDPYRLYRQEEVDRLLFMERLREIELFAKAGVELGLPDVPEITDYFLGRAKELAAILGIDYEGDGSSA